MLEKKFIVLSKSLSGPRCFSQRRMTEACDYARGLNTITKKNKHLPPLICTLLDLFAGAKLYTKLDLIAAYNLLRIKHGNKWKTAFRCRYGHFEYQVILFGLVNAPAVFQAYMNHALREYMDMFVIYYLDDIVVYSLTIKAYTEHV